MAGTVQDFLDHLIARHRVILIGGLAVIAHGLSRHTKHADVWLDPMDSSASWAGFLEQACAAFSGTSLHRIPDWQRVERGAVAQAVEEVGMVRVQGLNLPLDVFRRPNGFEETDFEAVLHDSSRRGDGSYLPSPVDLIQTKNDTGRKSDIFHLEALIQEDYRRRLPAPHWPKRGTCSVNIPSGGCCRRLWKIRMKPSAPWPASTSANLPRREIRSRRRFWREGRCRDFRGYGRNSFRLRHGLGATSLNSSTD